MSLCKVESCNKNEKLRKGLCGMHYRRLRLYGDVNFINPKCNRDGNYLTRKYEAVKAWKKKNWAKYKAYLEARRMRTKLATPKWADLSAIEQFYKNRPEGYHVDHIVPLNGKIVSGLHIMNNLQYLPAKANLKKSNK